MEFRDLKSQYQRYKQEIDSSIQGVIDSGSFIGGGVVEELEELLAEYVGVDHCISCANGTEAMALVLMAWGVEKGDAVFVPDFTFFSTGEVVSFRGATPIFIDVNRDTFNIDVSKLEDAIKKTIEEGKLRARAIIPVDLFGLPANHYEIDALSKKYNLLVLEDGAQGFGGSINGKKACSFGNAATTSFFPAKPLGCYGDGGAIFTNDSSLAEALKSLRVHGKGKSKYDNIQVGVNSRLDTIQASILKVKLKAFVEHELENVNLISRFYNEQLRSVVDIPVIPEGYYSSFAQYTIKLGSKEERDGLQRHLRGNGIPSMVYYQKGLHSQAAFSHLKNMNFDYSVSNKLTETVLSLPMHPYLSKEEVDKVCSSIKEYLASVSNIAQFN
ncbi:aminotransferase DegT [Paenibacillus sp. MY03]|uniref:DegT/DnrJ/EryC1/StrS family aminotransferase n=1 Tax=Paenibacillus sp. MY03 TaxID=302980 RepID=UPI000B3CC4D8|nr:DegT/DnrJ/EryC1/StrS aminotransferase family protein [Paenibacillus sp. MY03]OUS69959.1 aminotransferase DegT [Paenibacillus sp. MY03]